MKGGQGLVEAWGELDRIDDAQCLSNLGSAEPAQSKNSAIADHVLKKSKKHIPKGTIFSFLMTNLVLKNKIKNVIMSYVECNESRLVTVVEGIWLIFI